MTDLRQRIENAYDQALQDEPKRRTAIKSALDGTPITPTARVTSAFSTPGSTFNIDPDAIIIELTPRDLRIGYEGEASPQRCIRFTPEDGRRHADTRLYLPGYVRRRENLRTWGKGYELWRNDLADCDLELMSDRLEKIVRNVFNTVLLTEIGVARLVLVLPSLVPHPVLQAILQMMFERWPFSSITLQPSTAMALIGAGLRSGLVIDIGWEETVVTALYELREVRTMRTTRGMKSFTKRFGNTVGPMLSSDCRFDVEYIEEVVSRLGSELILDSGSKTISIRWATDKFTKMIDLEIATLRDVTIQHFFGDSEDYRPDDHELSLDKVVYNCLLALSADVRAIALSRLVFVGDGSRVTRLDSLVVKHLEKLVHSRGWYTVERRPSIRRIKTTPMLAQHGARPVDARHDDIVFGDRLVEERYLKERLKHHNPVMQGKIRQVSTVGSWAGASLLASLKVQSLVEVQRDRFLSHGLSSALRDPAASAALHKRIGAMGSRAKSVERSSWTLAGWG